MLQRKIKNKALIVMIMGVLLLVSPFHTINAEGVEADDYTYINAYQFWLAYGLNAANASEKISLSYNTGTGIISGYTYDMTYNPMSVPSGSSFNRYSAYNSSNRLRLTADPTYIVFICNTNITANNIVAYPQSGSVTATRITNDRLTVNSPNKLYLIVVKAFNNASTGTVYTTLDFTNATSSTTVLPLFIGTESVMSDEIHRLVFGTSQTYSVTDTQLHSDLLNVNNNISQGFANTNTKLTEINTGINTLNQATANIFSKATSIDNKLTDTNNYLYNIMNGTTSTNNSVSDLNTQSSQLDTSVTNFNNLEDTFNSNFTNDFNNIDFNSSLVSNSSLLSSMSWVRTQFDRMTSNNVIGTFIQYSLLFGLGLLVIGLL